MERNPWKSTAAFVVKDEDLVYNSSVAQDFLQLASRCHVISIIGDVGTGKSTLLNILSGCDAFAPGHHAEAQTKGIFVIIVPSRDPAKPDRMFIDTQGIGEDDKQDNLILHLVFSVSNAIIYNFKGKVDGFKECLAATFQVLDKFREFLDRMLKDKKRILAMSTAFYLVQRDKEPNWDNLGTYIHRTGILVPPSQCFSFPRPCNARIDVDLHVAQNIVPEFTLALNNFAQVVNTYLATAVPFYGPDIHHIWTSIMDSLDNNGAIQAFFTSNLPLRLRHVSEQTYYQLMDAIEISLQRIKIPSNYTEINNALKRALDIHNDAINLLDAEFKEKIKKKIEKVRDKKLNENFNWYIKQGIADLTNKQLRGLFVDEFFFQRAVSIASERVATAMAGWMEKTAMKNKINEAMKRNVDRLKEISQHQWTDTSQRAFNRIVDVVSSQLPTLTLPQQTVIEQPVFNTVQQPQPDQFQFKDDPSISRDSYQIKMEGGRPGRAVYAAVYDANGNLIARPGARHNDRAAATALAEAQLARHIEQKRNENEARKQAAQNEFNQRQREQQENYQREKAKVDTENQQKKEQYEENVKANEKEYQKQEHQARQKYYEDILMSEVKGNLLASIRQNSVYLVINWSKFNSLGERVQFLAQHSASATFYSTLFSLARKVLYHVLYGALQAKLGFTAMFAFPAIIGFAIALLAELIIQRIANPKKSVTEVLKGGIVAQMFGYVSKLLPYRILGFILDIVTDAYFLASQQDLLNFGSKIRDRLLRRKPTKAHRPSGDYDDDDDGSDDDASLDSSLTDESTDSEGEDYAEVQTNATKRLQDRLQQHFMRQKLIHFADQDSNKLYSIIAFELYKRNPTLIDPVVNVAATKTVRRKLATWLKENSNKASNPMGLKFKDAWNDWEERIKRLEECTSDVVPDLVMLSAMCLCFEFTMIIYTSEDSTDYILRVGDVEDNSVPTLLLSRMNMIAYESVELTQQGIARMKMPLALPEPSPLPTEPIIEPTETPAEEQNPLLALDDISVQILESVCDKLTELKSKFQSLPLQNSENALMIREELVKIRDEALEMEKQLKECISATKVLQVRHAIQKLCRKLDARIKNTFNEAVEEENDQKMESLFNQMASMYPHP